MHKYRFSFNKILNMDRNTTSSGIKSISGTCMGELEKNLVRTFVGKSTHMLSSGDTNWISCSRTIGDAYGHNILNKEKRYSSECLNFEEIDV